MNVRLLGAVFVLLASALVQSPPPAAADGEVCPDPTVSLLQVSADCEWSLNQYDTTTASEEHVWSTDLVCEVGGAAQCAVFLTCTVDNETAFMHQIFMDGVPVGQVCLPEERERIDIGREAIRQFKRMDWPASELVIQPPGGATLVNFATNFYTKDDRPVSRTVKIAGRQVEIRATQATYTFRFGDGTVVDSATPGRPNPHLDVTHTYLRAVPVKVSLDTTYSGEYRIGDGEWTPIVATLTVAGPEQGLDVVEALPQLVIR